MADVAYLIELTIQDGKLEDFKQKAAAFAQGAQADEPGTLEYQWWLSEDGSRCLLKEAFDSSESLLKHLGNVGPTLPELLAIAPITRLEVFGDPSEEARAALAPLGAQYVGHFVGFER